MGNAIKFKPSGAPALSGQYVQVTEATSAPRAILYEGDTLATDEEGYVTVNLPNVDVGTGVIVKGDSFNSDLTLFKGFNGYSIVENIEVNGLHLFSDSYAVFSTGTPVSSGFRLYLDLSLTSLEADGSEWIYSDWGSQSGDYSMAVIRRGTDNTFTVVVSTTGADVVFKLGFPITEHRNKIHLNYDGKILGTFVNNSYKYASVDLPERSGEKVLGADYDYVRNFNGYIYEAKVNDDEFFLSTDQTTYTVESGETITLSNTTFEADAQAEYEASDSIGSGYNVIVLAGQSNMTGNDFVVDGIDNDYSDVQGVMQLGTTGVIMQAENVMDYNSNDKFNKMGLWLELVKSIKSTMDDKPILIIMTAKPSTGFANNWWNEGDSGYNETAAKINSIMSCTESSLKGFFWLQGEADVSNDATYAATLGAMWTALKNDCTSLTDNTPFVCGEILKDTTDINNQLATFSSSLNKGAIVETRDLTDVGDNLHYDAPSLRTIGQRMGLAYLDLLD